MFLLHESFGTNWCITEIQAAIGRLQLRKLDGWVGIHVRQARTAQTRLVARELGETSLMLLVHPTLTEQNIEDTIRIVRNVICRATK